MGEIPITWKFKAVGSEELKTKLNEVNRLLNQQGTDVKDLDRAKRDYVRTANQVVRSQTQMKNIFLASHPNILRLSRAMSTMNSVFRAGMAVSQTLSLMFLRQNSASAKVAETTLDVDIKQRAYNNAVRDFGAESDEAIRAFNELQGAIAANNEAVSEEKASALQKYFDIFATAGTVISTTFTALTANPKVAEAVFKAASYAGKLFGWIFQGFVKLVVMAMDWLFPTLTGKNAMAGTARAGTLLGTSFGLSLIAAAAGAISGLALGTLLFDPIDKWMRDHFPGYKGFAEARDIESQ